MTREELKEKAADLPLAPGVYLMMDKMGKVIYVGKAKKLKNRVSQYFQDSASHTVKTRQKVSQIDHKDTIIVSSEFEALVLENSLIKRHMPRYNILLKDDKGYPFVRLSRETYPRFTMVSRYANDSARYFGPFGGRFETRQALDIMEDQFITYGSAQIMVANISQDKAEELKDQIAGINGVQGVEYDNTQDHYNNASALYAVTFD